MNVWVYVLESSRTKRSVRRASQLTGGLPSTMLFRAVLLLVVLSCSDTSAAPNVHTHPGGEGGNLNTSDGTGGYHFFYNTPSATRTETGAVVDGGGTNEHMRVTGQYSWTTPDGTVYTVNYTAGERGYHAIVKSETKYQEGPEQCTLTRAYSDQGVLLHSTKQCDHLAFSPAPGRVSSHDTRCAAGFTGPDCQDKLGSVGKNVAKHGCSVKFSYLAPARGIAPALETKCAVGFTGPGCLDRLVALERRVTVKPSGKGRD